MGCRRLDSGYAPDHGRPCSQCGEGPCTDAHATMCARLSTKGHPDDYRVCPLCKNGECKTLGQFPKQLDRAQKLADAIEPAQSKWARYKKALQDAKDLERELHACGHEWVETEIFAIGAHKPIPGRPELKGDAIYAAFQRRHCTICGWQQFRQSVTPGVWPAWQSWDVPGDEPTTAEATP